jgi:hypothetical protein
MLYVRNPPALSIHFIKRERRCPVLTIGNSSLKFTIRRFIDPDRARLNRHYFSAKTGVSIYK